MLKKKKKQVILVTVSPDIPTQVVNFHKCVKCIKIKHKRQAYSYKFKVFTDGFRTGLFLWVQTHIRPKDNALLLEREHWGTWCVAVFAKQRCRRNLWSLTLGGKKEIHVHLLRNSETLWPLICQSSIQPIICTMKTGCKTSQVNRNRIKHNSVVALNMVTEQTRWQKAANTEGKQRSLYISVIPFPS